MAWVRFELRRNMHSNESGKTQLMAILSRSFLHRAEQITTTRQTHSSAIVNHSWGL